VKSRPGVGAFAAAGLVALVAGSVHAAESTAWRVVRGDVRVVCPLTVGGSFEAKTASLAGTLTPVSTRPAAFAGPLTIDLRTLDTGIGLRDEHMRNTYLEVGKGEGFDTAVLSDIDLGEVAAETLRGRTRFTGTLLLHGVTKTVAGLAEVRREGASVRVEASFPVALADYGIAKPQYLGVGVRNEVEVKASLVATAAASAASR
jgi:polyisoprenoid-binding protein YceI